MLDCLAAVTWSFSDKTPQQPHTILHSLPIQMDADLRPLLSTTLIETEKLGGRPWSNFPLQNFFSLLTWTRKRTAWPWASSGWTFTTLQNCQYKRERERERVRALHEWLRIDMQLTLYFCPLPLCINIVWNGGRDKSRRSKLPSSTWSQWLNVNRFCRQAWRLQGSQP